MSSTIRYVALQPVCHLRPIRTPLKLDFEDEPSDDEEGPEESEEEDEDEEDGSEESGEESEAGKKGNIFVDALDVLDASEKPRVLV